MKSRVATGRASESPRRDKAWSVFCGLAMFTWVVVFIAATHSGVGAHEGAAVGYSVALLILGSLAFFMLSGWPKKRRFEGLCSMCFLLVSLALLPVTRSSTASLYSRLEALEGVLGEGGLHDHDEVQAFHHAAAIYEALVAAGTVSPDLSGLSAQISACLAEGKDIAPSVAGSALAMGLLSENDIQRLLEIRSPAINELTADIERQAADGDSTGISPRTYTHDDIRLFVAAGDLNDGDQAALTEIVMKEWPGGREYWALHYAMGCVRSLELLGRDDLVQSKLEATQAQLTERWMKPKRIGWFGEAGGFRKAVDYEIGSPIKETCEAVELMARFGIPDGVDPFLLRGYLQHEASVSPGIAMFFPDDHSHSYALAALHRLDHQIGMPKRDWLARLLAQKLILITAIILLMCAWIVWRTPQTVDPVVAAEAGRTSVSHLDRRQDSE